MRVRSLLLAAFLLVLSLTGTSFTMPRTHSRGVEASLLPYLSSLPLFTANRELETFSAAVPGTDVQVTLDTLPQNEPSIAVSPANSSILAAGANDYRLAAIGFDAWAGIYISKNGGRTWSNGLLPGYPTGPTSALSGFDAASDPALAFDLQGNLYYSGIAFNRVGTGAKDGTVFVAKSTDSGSTFTVRIAALGSGNTFNDKSYIAVDTTNSSFSGRVYVSWTQFKTTAKILFSFSSDGGNTFSTPRVVSNTNSNQGSIPAIGPNGEVYVAWTDNSNGRIKVAKSTNGGVSFSSPVIAATPVPIPSPLPGSSFRTSTFPAFTVDPQTGTLYVAWNDYATGNSNILLARSVNGGLTFTSPVKINDDLTSNDQFFPWLKSVDGRVSAVFYDRRLDSSNHNLDVFYTDSSDQGLTFSSNTRVTDTSFSPDVEFGGQFIGDYIGLAVTKTDAYPVWTDTRNLDQDIFTDRIAIVQVHDIALTAVSVPRRVGYIQISANPLQVTVTVANQGNIPENATVQLSILNGPSVENRTVSVLPGASTSIVLSVSTQNMAKGTYALAVSATKLANETDTADNSIDPGSINVRSPGDVNGNGVVNIIDAAILALAFGKTCGNPGYIDAADLDNDCDVDIIDAATLAIYFGIVDP